MHFNLCTIDPAEEIDHDRIVIENRKQFVNGFQKAFTIVLFVFLAGEVVKVASVQAVEKSIEKSMELQPTANIEKAIVMREILELPKKRQLTLNGILGFLFGLLVAWVVADAVKTNRSFNAEQAQIDKLHEGVIKMSRLLDEKHESFLKYGM
jgi:hypothetical protein